MTRTPRSFVAVFIVLFSFRSIAQPPPPPGNGWFDALFKDNAPLVAAFATGAAIAGGLVWLIMRQPGRADAPQVPPAVQAVVGGVVAAVGGLANVAPDLGGGVGCGARPPVHAVVLPGLAPVELVQTRALDPERIQALKMLMLELRGVRNQETHEKVLAAMRDMTYEELKEVEKVFQGFWAEVFNAPVSHAIVEAPSDISKQWQQQRLSRRSSTAPTMVVVPRTATEQVDYLAVRNSFRQCEETPITKLLELARIHANTKQPNELEKTAQDLAVHLQTMTVEQVREAAKLRWFWMLVLGASDGGGSVAFTALTPEQFEAAMQEFLVKLKPLPEDTTINDVIATMRFAALAPGMWTPYIEALFIRAMQRIGKEPENAASRLRLLSDSLALDIVKGPEEVLPSDQLILVEDLNMLWARVLGGRAPDFFHCYKKLPETFSKIMKPFFTELVLFDERLTQENFIELMKELQVAYTARQAHARKVMRTTAQPMIERFMALANAQKTAENLHAAHRTTTWFTRKSKLIADARKTFLATVEDPRMHFLFTEGEQAMMLELEAVLAKRKGAKDTPLAIEAGGPEIEVLDEDEADKEVLRLK